jgi:DNA polymerase III subunit gamma/tau
MAYIVLARKWRPMVFEDVIGQEHVTRTLMNALKNERIAHAYIFAGPRGVGKTTTARLLAKAVNCERQPAVNPCNECPNCKSITEGHNLDVIEIDGASNRGIDEIRNLRENIRFAPASNRYKIYIIDEVHMLTKEAFNALLKTLEEPPSHAIFIFATTEIHKVPLTILSRCQRFDFKRLSIGKIVDQLRKIVTAENIEINDEALLLIARKADGSMRDGESILDQMISFSDGKLSVEQVRLSLGMIDQDVYFNFTDLLKKKDTAEVLKYADQIISSGHDLVDFIHGLQEHFRNLLLVSALQDSKLLDVTDYYAKRYESDAASFNERDLIHYIHIISEGEQELKFSTFPQLALEMLLLKITHLPPSEKLEEILALIKKLKENPEISISQNTAPTTRQEQPKPDTKASATNPADQASQHDANIPELKSSPEPAVSGNRVGEELGRVEKRWNEFKKLDQKAPPTENEESEVTIDLSAVAAKWPEIVEKVRSQKIALGSFLQEGVPYKVDEGKLLIAYDKQSEFHREHVEKGRKLIEEIMKTDFNLPIHLDFFTMDFKKEGIAKQPRTPEEIIQDIKNKEPIIRKIIDMFDLDENSDQGIS